MAMTALRSFKVFGSMLQTSVPYLLLEIVLPGGTLFALLLFLYRRKHGHGTANTPRVILVIERAIGKVSASITLLAKVRGIASVWRSRHAERDGLEAFAIAPIM